MTARVNLKVGDGPGLLDEVPHGAGQPRQGAGDTPAQDERRSVADERVLERAALDDRGGRRIRHRRGAGVRPGPTVDPLPRHLLGDAPRGATGREVYAPSVYGFEREIRRRMDYWEQLKSEKPPRGE